MIAMRKLTKAVVFMLTLLMPCSLFGCKKTSDFARYDTSEIVAVSISCASMDRRSSYSFGIYLDDGAWLFNADCFTSDHETETVFKGRGVAGEDVEELLQILKENDSIAYAKNYKKPGKSFFNVADGDSYSFCLTFSDGNQYVTGDRQNDLEEFFYHLVKKHDEAISE